MDDPGSLRGRASEHLQILCRGRDRRPGSAENLGATEYVAECFARSGWDVSQQAFEVVAWEGGAGSLTVGRRDFPLHASPYGVGVNGTGPLVVARSREELLTLNVADAVVLLRGPLTDQPLTPKAFPFYQVDEHQRLVAFLENAQPTAIVAATGSCPEMAGAVSPFPLIEDGDFTVPVAHVDVQTGDALAAAADSPAHIVLDGRRRVAQARNVIARRGNPQRRAVLMAHIDTKVGTPGALDNAAGVVVLLLLAETLDPRLAGGVELLILNGEDYFNAAGEVRYLAECGDDLSAVTLAVNLDGLGYRRGRTAFSLYNCDDQLAALIRRVLKSPGMVEGPQWWQSDHTVFAVRGRPALALTSEFQDEVLREFVHSPDDRTDQVDPTRLAEAAHALSLLVGSLMSGAASLGP